MATRITKLRRGPLEGAIESGFNPTRAQQRFHTRHMTHAPDPIPTRHTLDTGNDFNVRLGQVPRAKAARVHRVPEEV